MYLVKDGFLSNAVLKSSLYTFDIDLAIFESISNWSKLITSIPSHFSEHLEKSTFIFCAHLSWSAVEQRSYKFYIFEMLNVLH